MNRRNDQQKTDANAPALPARTAISSRIATCVAIAMLGLLIVMAAPKSLRQNEAPGNQLAFSDEIDSTTTTSATIPPTTITPTTVTPTTIPPTTITPTTVPPKSPRPARILLVGDSIAHETRVPFADMLMAKDIALDTVTFPGLAPCDLYEAAQETTVSRPSDVVILLFTGNAISPCMSEANDPSSEPYFSRYRTDMTAMVELFSPNGPDVWVVEPLPYPKQSTNQTVARLDEIFRSIEGVNGAIPTRDLFTPSSIADPSGEFASSLPCLLPDEPCPNVRVRAEDNVHLGDDGTSNQFGRKRLAFAFIRFIDSTYE